MGLILISPLTGPPLEVEVPDGQERNYVASYTRDGAWATDKEGREVFIPREQISRIEINPTPIP